MVFSSGIDRASAFPPRRLMIVTAWALVAALLSACSMGGGASEPDASSTSVATTAPTLAPRVQLGTVVWSTALAQNGEPTESLDAFPRDAPVIYAAAPVDAVVAGETVTANWSLDGVPIDALASTVALDGAAESGWVSFALTWEGETLWPVGSLEVSIVASSGSMVSGAIRIEST